MKGILLEIQELFFFGCLIYRDGKEFSRKEIELNRFSEKLCLNYVKINKVIVILRGIRVV